MAKITLGQVKQIAGNGHQATLKAPTFAATYLRCAIASGIPVANAEKILQMIREGKQGAVAHDGIALNVATYVHFFDPMNTPKIPISRAFFDLQLSKLIQEENHEH